MKKRINGDVFIGAAIDIVCICFWVIACSFRKPEAATWPKAVIGITALLSTILLVRGILRTKKAWADGTEMTGISADGFRGVVIAMIAMTVYAIAMKYVGFFVSTTVFLPAAIWTLGHRKWYTLLGVTIGLQVFIYFLFVVQLKLRMP